MFNIVTELIQWIGKNKANNLVGSLMRLTKIT